MKLVDVFATISDFNYQNRSIVFIATIALTIFFSVGLFNLKMETDPQNLWVSKDTIGYQQESNFDDQFGAFFRTEQIILAQNDKG